MVDEAGQQGADRTNRSPRDQWEPPAMEGRRRRAANSRGLVDAANLQLTKLRERTKAIHKEVAGSKEYGWMYSSTSASVEA